jgi:hypothetical protein
MFFVNPNASSPPLTQFILYNLYYINVHDGVYSVQHRVIKCVSDLRQVGGFLFYLFCSSIVINTVIVTAGTFEA